VERAIGAGLLLRLFRQKYQLGRALTLRDCAVARNAGSCSRPFLHLWIRRFLAVVWEEGLRRETPTVVAFEKVT
jgi:hypothetical protein